MSRSFKNIKISVLFSAFIFLFSFSHLDASIDLVTVPSRESVQLTIYNSADITMVRETRILTFKKGLNTVQFAWAGTLIDPTSLRIRFKEKKSELTLLDTTYPPNIHQALQWNIKSKIAGPVRIEITYFTSGITWRADYVVLTNQNEKRMDLKGNVTVINNSGEDYPNAKVRLIVGTINLVEDIATLAQRPVSYYRMPVKTKARMRRRFEGYVKKARPSGGAKLEEKKKEIIKEGFSEYFLFTIEGRETVPNGWQKKLNSIYVENVPLKVIYRLSDRKTYGRVYKYYEFYNRKIKKKKGKGQLGESPLPDGVVKIFTEDKKKNLTYIASVYIKYIPNGGKVKLNSGQNNDIRIKRVLKDYKRKKIKLETRWNKRKYVKHYNEHFFYETTLENTLPRKVLIEIERSFSGKFKLKKVQFKREKVDLRTIRYYPDIGPDKKIKKRYEVVVSH